MSNTTSSLRRKIASAGDLRSVVRTMKAVAASSIGQYESSVVALADYVRTVERGLGACFRANEPAAALVDRRGRASGALAAIVFGSDQGLVGQFNEVVADDAMQALAAIPRTAEVWAVGERVRARLADGGVAAIGVFAVPTSVTAIAGLVGQILVASDARHDQRDVTELHLFYNRSTAGAGVEPVRERVLPLDAAWRRQLVERRWPTKTLPEVMGDVTATLRAFIREYVFVSLFRACAESLASENTSRLAAMERADKNIDGMLEDLEGDFHRLRQDGIDEELFDVVAGFEALSAGKPRGHAE